MGQLFTSDNQSIGVSVSVLPMNIQGWFPLWLTDLISLLSQGLSRVFSSTTIWKQSSSILSLLYGPTLTSIYDYWKNHSFIQTFVNNMISLHFNTLARCVIAFLSRSQCLLLYITLASQKRWFWVQISSFLELEGNEVVYFEYLVVLVLLT